LLREVMAARPEAKVLSLAVREYQFALYALAAANYRYAFISLRLFFELALSTVQFFLLRHGRIAHFRFRRYSGPRPDLPLANPVANDPNWTLA
jgi:hypothetical protein